MKSKTYESYLLSGPHNVFERTTLAKVVYIVLFNSVHLSSMYLILGMFI
jgi:hypothetical protein